MCFFGFLFNNKPLLKISLKGFLSGEGMRRHWCKNTHQHREQYIYAAIWRESATYFEIWTVHWSVQNGCWGAEVKVSKEAQAEFSSDGGMPASIDMQMRCMCCAWEPTQASCLERAGLRWTMSAAQTDLAILSHITHRSLLCYHLAWGQ